MSTEEVCAICLDSIHGESLTRLRCGHNYHGQCIATALFRDPRCPTCRDTFVEEDDEQSLTLDEAFRIAIARTDTDRGRQRSLEKLLKWKTIGNEATTDLKTWNRVLRPSQAAKDHKINAYRCKVETEHYRSHQEIYKLRDHALRQKRKSDMYTQRIVLNIARRYGGYRD